MSKLLKEDGDASVGVDISGMGDISNGQPSNLPGNTIEPSFTNNGGVVGSGDVSNIYGYTRSTPSNRSRRKKSNKLDIKKIKREFDNIYKKSNDTNMNKSSKVMNFDSFTNSEIFKVTKVKESHGKCDRCNCSTNRTIMSYFNTDMICMDCCKEEKEDPDYIKAVEIENKEVAKGNFNYPGYKPNYKKRAN